MRTNLKRLISTVASALICLGLIIGCNRVPSPLAEADLVIEDHPDSALAILREVDTVTLTKERDKALYGLLLTQAKVKKRFKDIDTTLAGSARRYFNLHPEKDYRLRANYYSAYRQYLDSCYNPSIVGAANSYLEAEDANDALWTARSAELIGAIFNACGLPQNAIKYNQIAVKHYNKAGKNLNSLFSESDLGINFAGSYKFEKADSVFKEVLRKNRSSSINDTNLVCYVLRTYLYVNDFLGRYAISDSIVNAFRQLKNSYPSTFYSHLSIKESFNDNFEKANCYLDSAKEAINDRFDEESYYDAKLIYAKRGGFTNMEKEANDSLSEIKDRFIKSSKINPANTILTSVTEDFFSKKHVEQSNKNSQQILLAVILIILFLVAVVILFWQVKKTRNQLKEKDKRLQLHLKRLDIINELMNDKDATIDDIQYRLDSYKNETGLIINESKDKIKNLSSLVKEEISIVKKLYESFPEFEGPNVNIAQRALLLRKQVISNFNNETIELLINCTDIINGGLNSKLKNACPNLSKIYIDIFSLLSLGFSSKSICCLLNQKRSTIDQRKRRLREIIVNSNINIEDKKVYLNILTLKKGKNSSKMDELLM